MRYNRIISSFLQKFEIKRVFLQEALMSIFNKIETQYCDFSLEIKRKASVLFSMNFIIGSLALLLCIVYIIIGREISRITVLGLVVAVFTISQMYLMKKEYELASNIHLFSLLIVLFALRLVSSTDITDFLISVVLYVVLIYDASLIGIAVYQVWAISVSSVFFTIGILLMMIFKYKTLNSSKELSVIIFGIILLIIVASMASFLFILMGTSKNLIFRLYTRKKKCEKRSILKKMVIFFCM